MIQGWIAAPKYIDILYHPYVNPYIPALLGLIDHKKYKAVYRQRVSKQLQEDMARASQKTWIVKYNKFGHRILTYFQGVG